jgi:GntR family transcriptional regulator
VHAADASPRHLLDSTCMDKFAATAAPDEQTIVERFAERPLHQQIADQLRQQILAGCLRPGDALPSESALMRQFGVSRGTIRQARAALRADGTIGGSRGRRLSVRGTPLTQPLGELVSFTSWVRSLGKEPGGRVIAFTRESASDAAALALSLAPGDAVWRLERVRLADGEPLLIERTIFPEAIGTLLIDVDLNAYSVYEQLAARGVTVSAARHLIDAVTATPADAALLQIAPGTALLRVVRQASAADGRPVEWSDDRNRGDAVNFAVENRAGDTGLVRQLTQETVAGAMAASPATHD